MKGLRKRLKDECETAVKSGWEHSKALRLQRRQRRSARTDDPSAIPIDSDQDSIAEMDVSEISPTVVSSSSNVASLMLAEKVECPICSIKILSSRINQHLDQCLGKEENRDKPPTVPSTTAAASSSSRLPFPAYNILTDKQLKKLLSQLGFPTASAAGSAALSQDRESLIRRHREFILRHNAEQDSSNPMSDANLVKDIIRKEKIVASSSASKNSKQSLLLEKFATNETTVTTNAPLSSSSMHAVAAAVPVLPPSSRKRSHVDPISSSSISPLSAPVAPDSPSKVTLRRRSLPVSPTRAASGLTSQTEDLTGEDDAPNSTGNSDSAPRSSSPMRTQAASSSTIATFASSSLSTPANNDPFAILIAQYEAKHGKRKRWRRAWGVDESLYPSEKSPTVIEIDDSESTTPITATSSVEGISVESATNSSDLKPSNHSEYAKSSSTSNKAVFSLFQLKSSEVKVETATSSTLAATVVTNSTTPATGPKGTGAIRVSSAVCSQCHRVCKGSFPLGASIVCPKCRPNWTQIAASVGGPVMSSSGPKKDPDVQFADAPKANWMQIAQAQLIVQQQQQLSQQLPQPVTFVVASPSPSLSTEQKQLIESRRIAALEKLKGGKGTESSDKMEDISLESTSNAASLSTSNEESESVVCV